jgi:hypothetical protein
VVGGYAGTYHVGGVGIDLAAGGTVTNTGSITGGLGGISGYKGTGDAGNGVDLRGGGTLTNHGMIVGGQGGYYVYGQDVTFGAGGIGVLLASPGSVTNDGTIMGGDGHHLESYGAKITQPAGSGGAGFALSDGGTLKNAGTVTGGAGGYGRYVGGNAGYGLGLTGGIVTNSGTITGGAGGVSRFTGGNGAAGVLLRSGTLTNTGGIVGGAGGYTTQDGIGGAAGAGVTMRGGVLVNSGSITGGYNGKYAGGNGGTGVYINGGTLTNAGTITGGIGTHNYVNGDAVKFGPAAATLAVDPGAVFAGNVAGDGNAKLVLAAGQQAWQLNGLGEPGFIGFKIVTEQTGAVWSLTGTTNLAGTKLDAAGTLTFTGAVVQTPGGHGSVTLDSGSTVTTDGSLGVASLVFGAGGGELLALGEPTSVTSTAFGVRRGRYDRFGEADGKWGVVCERDAVVAGK